MRLATLAALLLAFAPAALAGSLPLSHLATDVSIQPAGDGVFLCRVRVLDAATEELVAAPEIRFKSGETAATTTFLDTSGAGTTRLKIQVQADGAEARAILQVSLLRDDGETTLQRLRIRLR